jgi:hypothetical protein
MLSTRLNQRVQALLLRARWMQESDRFDPDTIGKEFTKASDQHEFVGLATIEVAKLTHVSGGRAVFTA